MIKQVLNKLTNNQELTEPEIFDLIAAISNDQLSDVQIAGFQVALLMKGPTLNEISAIAKAMRANCIPIPCNIPAGELMDTDVYKRQLLRLPVSGFCQLLCIGRSGRL